MEEELKQNNSQLKSLERHMEVKIRNERQRNSIECYEEIMALLKKFHAAQTELTRMQKMLNQQRNQDMPPWNQPPFNWDLLAEAYESEDGEIASSMRMFKSKVNQLAEREVAVIPPQTLVLKVNSLLVVKAEDVDMQTQ